LWLGASKDKKIAIVPSQWKKVGYSTHLSSQLWREAMTRMIAFKVILGKKGDPIFKITRAKRA
jgi:hypothetical protein